ncbi:Zinc finger protein [Pseudolycoriella hygida]|uniref:Zinc finger protein n=1 Tax=Pseudolycoriella hygida TaxID=35572 RepID=A0A9Q0MRT5_9DIPT|nr:Zinc finger protein [Pseudolycoriella hygida]
MFPLNLLHFLVEKIINRKACYEMCSNTLPCPLCCQPNFQSIDSLRISLVNVTNRPLECPICCDVLYGLDKLTIHLFSHSLNQEIPAETKNTKYDEGVTNVDLFIPSSDAKSESTDDNHFFNQLNQLNDSENKEKPSNKTFIEPQCDICGSTFRSTELHQMHMKLVHEVCDETGHRNGSTTGEKCSKNYFPCHLCSKTFKMKGSLRVHLKVVHSFGKTGHIGLTILDGQGSNNATESHATDVLCAAENKLNNVEVKAWECDICAKSFTTKYFLKKHKRLHTGEMPYSCEVCGKNFTFQQSYHKHLLYHSDEKPHICSTCGRAFKELSTLHNHERIHSGEKPYQCETCDKCFRQRVSYLVHRRIHTGSMPYKCTACEKNFRYKVSQRTHKCLAQPPGTVVRQTGDLLQKLIQSVSLTNTLEETIDVSDKDFINQSLDDFVKESYDKIGIGNDCGFEESSVSVPIEAQVPSPSEKFQNMCLYSPLEDLSFKELMYGDDGV